MIRYDSDYRPRGNALAESGNIRRTHPYAPVADRMTKKFFLRCSMNIDSSIKGILVAWLDTLQPQNSGHDWIAPRRIWLENLAGWDP